MKDFIPLFQTLLWICFAVLLILVVRPEINLFRKILAKRLEMGSSFELGPLKMGELKAELVKLADKVEEQRAEQEKQQSEIEILGLLLIHFISEHELDHLRKLASDEPFIFIKGPESDYFFQPELRHLLALGFIAREPGKDISTLFHEQGEVKKHFRITEAGKKYLELRASLTEAGQVGSV